MSLLNPRLPDPISKNRLRRVLSESSSLVEATQYARANPRYWYPFVLEELLERCDTLIFERAEDALSAASKILEFALAIPGLPKHDLAQAYAVKASALRVLGRYRDSHETYQQALGLVPQPSRPRALVLRRLSVLHFYENHRELALETLETAVAKLSDRRDDIVINLSLRAAFLFHTDPATAISLNLEVIRKSDPIKNSRVYIVATRNLATLLVNNPAADYNEVAYYLRRAYDALNIANGPSYRRRSHHRAMVRWSNALLLWRLGSHRQAARVFARAESGLLDCGAFQDLLVLLADRLKLAREIEPSSYPNLLAHARRMAQKHSPDPTAGALFEELLAERTTVEKVRESLLEAIA